MKKQLAVLALTGLVSTTAMAEVSVTEPSMNYKYAEVAYETRSVSGTEITGFGVKGSYPIQDNVSVIGSVSQFSKDGSDTRFIRLGGTYQIGLGGASKKMDLVPHAEIYQVSFKSKACARVPQLGGGGFTFTEVCNTSDASETGLVAGAEFRAQMNQQFELYGDAALDTKGSKTNGTAILLTGGARFAVNDKVQLFGSYTLSDINGLRLGARFNF